MQTPPEGSIGSLLADDNACINTWARSYSVEAAPHCESMLHEMIHRNKIKPQPTPPRRWEKVIFNSLVDAQTDPYSIAMSVYQELRYDAHSIKTSPDHHAISASFGVSQPTAILVRWSAKTQLGWYSTKLVRSGRGLDR